MPAPFDEPLHRTTVMLFANDAAEMEAIYGRGWTEVIRNLVREHVKDKRPKTLTVGDLFGTK